MGQIFNAGLAFFFLVISVLGAGCDRREKAGIAPTTQTHSPTIASLVPAATDMLIGMGLGDHLVAVSNYEPDRNETRGLPRVGDYQTTDWERLAAVKPDVMVVQIHPDRLPVGLVQRAKAAGIRLVNVKIDRLEDVFKTMEQLSGECGNPAGAIAANFALRQKILQIHERVAKEKPVSTLLVVGEDGTSLAGKNNFLDDLLAVAGGENAAGAMGSDYPTVDREKLIAMKPAAIIQLLPGASEQVVEQAKSFWKGVDKIGRWFKGFRPVRAELPLDHDDNGRTNPDHNTQLTHASRGSFLRPWAKRDAAIANLTHGFQTLTDLMVAVRDNLEQQNRRQDELIRYMSHLPEALQLIPESARTQGETLKAIHQQISHQSQQQARLENILEKISDNTVEQRRALHGLTERSEVQEQHDQMISQNLQSVGVAMQSVSRNSESSTQVLQTLKENLTERDTQLERVLRKQNVRFTTMLAIAIFLSIAALAAVVIMGYLMINNGRLPLTSPSSTPPALTTPAPTPAT